jgi:chloramphenicol 3-O phosphotransferase
VRQPGLVVVLDGPSGVGKTHTVRGLQQAWPRVRQGPLLDVGLDHTLDAFGRRALPRWWDLIQRYDPPAPAAPERVTWGPLGRELVRGMHQAAADWARTGFDVVLEHVLLDRTTATDLATALAGLPVLHVGLVCDEDVLEAREAERRRRTLGLAVTQLRQTVEVTPRDVWLDTSMATTDELVEELLEAVAERFGLELG